MSLTVIAGQPGSGKSKVIRDRYLKASQNAVFLDGQHNEETVRQLRHEMGFFDHTYLFCSPDHLWPELEKLDQHREIFIDMPSLSTSILDEIKRLASLKRWRLTLTVRSVPSGLQDAEIIQL